MRSPGTIRDSIVGYLSDLGTEAPLIDIEMAVSSRIGQVSSSSIRSYLNLNTPTLFERTVRGHYRLKGTARETAEHLQGDPVFSAGGVHLYQGDCFDWLACQPPASIHAVVTDPPYGLVEYQPDEQRKLRAGRGGVWRIPPSFDGHQRSPLPRFTVLNADDRSELRIFFQRLGALLTRVLVPGANVVVASNPLLAHIVASALTDAGLEMRGTLVRLVMTMRGGDRPKNAHQEFRDVSVMPRSMWEPWIVLRRPLDGRVQDNLRRWKTGGFRRTSDTRPFSDLIKSRPASSAERRLAPHPSLKPQDFLRQLVRGVLPLGEGTVLDPFAGSGSTLAAAMAIGYGGIGIEKDLNYAQLAAKAIPRLAAFRVD
jgi:site-specific DNA-methyltransferase (adenine-specific)